MGNKKWLSKEFHSTKKVHKFWYLNDVSTLLYGNAWEIASWRPSVRNDHPSALGRTLAIWLYHIISWYFNNVNICFHRNTRRNMHRVKEEEHKKFQILQDSHSRRRTAPAFWNRSMHKWSEIFIIWKKSTFEWHVACRAIERASAAPCVVNWVRTPSSWAKYDRQ